MRAEIISVGTELLLGQIVDTNAVFLSRDLAARGVDVLHRSTVGDNRERLAEACHQALGRTDLVVTIGGLGPTEDDITRETASEVTGIGLVRDADAEAALRAFFERRGIPFGESNLKQAHRPSRGANLANPNGTAPGCAFDLGGKAIICLPGPPDELEPMWINEAIPWLRARGVASGEVIRSRVLRLVGIGESSLEPRIVDLLHGTNPTLAPYAKTGEVHLRVTAKAADEAAATTMIDRMEAQVRERLGEFIYGVDGETLEAVTVRACIAGSMRIATAESCTGGLIASRITDVPGSSDTMLAGLVCYSNDAKTEVLGVPSEMIARHGAVSEEVAVAMARGALERTGADIAVSDTGIAGPSGGTAEKPVGLVWIGVATRSRAWAERNLFTGLRATVKLRASQTALAMLRSTVLQMTKERSDR